MRVLGIETSCDETAAAVVSGPYRVLSSVVASQLNLHAPFGGVVPELASRQHVRDLPRVAEAALKQAGISWEQVEGVAATFGPGLMGALLVGLAWGKAAAFARSLPFVGVHHLEGHLLSAELDHPPLPKPFLGLVASGGHTSLFLVETGPSADLPAYRLLARTRDDAVGEAFDKVAKMLGLPYPGGPAIEQAAARSPATPLRFTVPRMKDGSREFSYSGLKTAVRVHVEQARLRGENVNASEVAAAFQNTVVRDLTEKTMAAAREHHALALALTGGVAANSALRESLARAAVQAGLPFYCPPFNRCTDNAAMIASAGCRHLMAGERSPWDLAARPTVELPSK